MAILYFVALNHSLVLLTECLALDQGHWELLFFYP